VAVRLRQPGGSGSIPLQKREIRGAVHMEKKILKNPLHVPENYCILENVADDETTNDAGWSSQVARRAHNPKVAGSNPVPATKYGAVV
jgi:hypothetical protein